MSGSTVEQTAPEPAALPLFAGHEWIGARKEQEDFHGVVPPEECGDGLLLALVADGMGGHGNGAAASQCVVDHFAAGFFASPSDAGDARLWDALESANRAVGDRIKQNPSLNGMGSTLLAILASTTSLHWISVGDSPLFLLRQGILRQVNEPHTESLLAAAGMADDADPQAPSNVLMAAIVGAELRFVDDGGPLPLLPGDTLLAASDGLLTLSPEEIIGILQSAAADGPQRQTAELIAALRSKNLPGQDNVTAIVIQIPS